VARNDGSLVICLKLKLSCGVSTRERFLQVHKMCSKILVLASEPNGLALRLYLVLLRFRGT